MVFCRCLEPRPGETPGFWKLSLKPVSPAGAARFWGDPLVVMDDIDHSGPSLQIASGRATHGSKRSAHREIWDSHQYYYMIQFTTEQNAKHDHPADIPTKAST